MAAAARKPWVSPILSSGLGNRLFKLAAAAGAAEAWGRPLVLYLPAARPIDHGPAESLYRMFPEVPVITEELPDGTINVINEPPRCHFIHYPFPPDPPAPGPLLINGYRQSPGYFPRAGVRVDWLRTLGPERAAAIAASAGLSDPAEQRRTVALHVRLGDYLQLPHHQQQLGHYYLKALERVSVGGRIHLFSDEPEKCKGMFASMCAERGLELSVAAVRLDVESLYEFTLCLRGTITANSTFSWWGAYFAHTAGAEWATYPDWWGAGQPEPTNVVPEWGITIPTAA